MRLTISTFLSALFVSTYVKADLNKSCQVNKYVGTCTYINGCQYYNNMIHNYQSLGLKAEDVFNILREINCGFIKSDALVCCPPKSSNDGLTFPQNDSEESQISGLISQPTLMPHAPNSVDNYPVMIDPVPVTLGYISSPTQAPFVGLPPDYHFPKFPLAQSHKAEQSIVTTIPEVPQTTVKDTTVQGIDNEKFKLLPQECGRVLTWKYFRGNLTEFDDFPWTALVEYETPTGKQFGCGGSLIHSRYVLTAAHCVVGLSASWKVSRVRFGEYDTDTDVDCLPDGPNITVCNDRPLDVVVENVIVHSGFNPKDPSRVHDIALLRLSVPVNFTGILKPICLPTKNPFPQKYYTSGWGKDVNKDSIRNGTHLKYMSYVSLVNQKTCQNKYREQADLKVSESYLCGDSMIPSENPCIGDAGGSLMGLEEIASLEKRFTAFGILSIHKSETGDCQSGDPIVYTKVLDYMNWILANLKV